MRRETIEEQVKALAQPVADACGVELVDVTYLSENGRWILRISIDREGGVTLDDCQRVSQALGDELDRVDPIPGSYSLEVSSPGLERPLRRPAEFQRFKGRLVWVRSYGPIQGSRSWEGRLLGVDDGQVVLETATGEVRIPLDRVAKAHLVAEL
ncbi:ribosome maturation factor RimP [Limnochorda pilosa]|uniref:Ribosome maturation factor RimP n=1 Tax=Limnochorda pilosa TaxID=1555112 RepID=A0A0K2SK91_LIMPI|nr:ribosome maturation factor RimP [Limnochorda pilosa]BAS27533.1 ribosome maturation factor RimP [Limnochorda pilosa]